MEKINWTAIVLAGGLFLVGLFIPSPLHKCPEQKIQSKDSSKVTIVFPGDTLAGKKTSAAIIKVPTKKKPSSILKDSIMLVGPDGSLGVINIADNRIVLFDSSIVYEIRDSLNGTKILFRNTTNVLVLKDSVIVENIYDYKITPKPYEEVRTKVEVTEVEPVIIPRPFYESPIVVIPGTALLVWALMRAFAKN